jgi:YidC/Oxa1 family membrane protein insertase
MSNQNQDSRLTLIFIAVMLVGFAAWYWAGNYFWPNKPVERLAKDQERAVRVAGAVLGGAAPDGMPWTALGPVAAAEAGGGKEKPAEKPKKPPEKPAAQEPIDPEQRKVVTLGGPDSHLTVRLNPNGAGILQLLLNHFQAADPRTGEPIWIDGDPKKGKQPLELIPQDKNREIASFLLYHYADPKDEPLDVLGRRVWKRVTPERVNGGEPVREAVFETEVDGVRITKTYTLEPGWYHVGLEVKLELLDAPTKFFRYQLQGPQGVPIEGQWFTSLYRNSLIGRVDEKDNVDRNFQDQRTIALKEGGDEVTRGDKSIRYAAIANQFFASGIAVATRDQKDRDFLGQARPLLVEGALKGEVGTPEGDEDVVLVVPDRETPGYKKYTFEYASPKDRERFEERLSPGAKVIVVHRTVIDRAGRSREVITDVLDPNQTAPVFHDDITVEVSTPRDKPIELKRGEPKVHKYVLYNGPVKVGLLSDHLFGEPPAVDPAEVAYYHDDLHLNTLTDYRSPGWFNDNVMSYTPWTTVVIFFTNVMHWVLWKLYCVTQYFMPNVLVYGLCILLLTVLVRGAMHPVSRKQARMTMRMQALQPELQKLKEKYKDDKQAQQMAQMELYRKHGINPLGSCWLMLLQMPVFLGLYYCLQESIHFRLAPFIPGWIHSLTAPDMLIHWGDRIPWISTWNDYGWFLWLGPYFNLLPVIAVALMIVQQKYTMPPPTDDQQALNAKMMKFMMIFFGLMFYKVAAGLCLYFIASSLWGFAERKLLPKKKPGEVPPPTASARPGLMQRLLGRLQEAQQRQQAGANGAAVRPAPAPAGGGKKKRGRPAPVPQDGLLAKFRAWWAEVLRQAEKR